MAVETVKAGGTARSRGGARGGGGGADRAGTATADGTTTRTRTRGGAVVVADGRRIRGGGSGATTEGAAATTTTRTRAASASKPTEEQREYAARQKAFAESFRERRAKGQEIGQADQVRWVAYETGLRTSQVASVLEAYRSLIGEEVGRKGPGSIKFLGLMRIHRAERAASKARKIVNPITKEPMMVPARKKGIVAKVRPLTALKIMVSGPKAATGRV